AAVSCSVTGSGSFTVNAQLNKAADGLEISVAGLAASATKNSPVTGSVGFTSPIAVKNYASDSKTPGKFYFVPGGGEGVAEGKVWVAFSCDSVTAEGTDTCGINESYAVFENCSQK